MGKKEELWARGMGTSGENGGYLLQDVPLPIRQSVCQFRTMMV